MRGCKPLCLLFLALFAVTVYLSLFHLQLKETSKLYLAAKYNSLRPSSSPKIIIPKGPIKRPLQQKGPKTGDLKNHNKQPIKKRMNNSIAGVQKAKKVGKRKKSAQKSKKVVISKNLKRTVNEKKKKVTKKSPTEPIPLQSMDE